MAPLKWRNFWMNVQGHHLNLVLCRFLANISREKFPDTTSCAHRKKISRNLRWLIDGTAGSDMALSSAVQEIKDWFLWYFVQHKRPRSLITPEHCLVETDPAGSTCLCAAKRRPDCAIRAQIIRISLQDKSGRTGLPSAFVLAVPFRDQTAAFNKSVGPFSFLG